MEDSKKKKPKQARRLTGRCWMAEDFPMSLKQLLPILDVIGNANKHIARVGKFLQKYGDMSLFPVKLQVRSRLHLKTPLRNKHHPPQCNVSSATVTAILQIK